MRPAQHSMQIQISSVKHWFEATKPDKITLPLAISHYRVWGNGTAVEL